LALSILESPKFAAFFRLFRELIRARTRVRTHTQAREAK
jgi:hypothetical protein